jgi:TolB protein
MPKLFSIAAILVLATSAIAQSPKDTIFYQDVAWSPDGAGLLMSRMDIKGENYQYRIFSVDTNGGNYKKITEGPNDVWTSWAPDGQRFAHASKKDGNTDIYLKNLQTGASIRLTTDSTRDSHPDWSPDKNKIAYISRKNGLSQINTIDTNGSNIVALTVDSVPKDNPRWSPDGKRIAYFGNTAGKDSIYIIDADGDNKVTLCEGVWPSWFLDGERILFTLDDNIYQITIGDSVKTKVIDNAYFARLSPDGKKIAFIRNTWRAEKGWPATSAVFIVNRDGSGESQVTPK